MRRLLWLASTPFNVVALMALLGLIGLRLIQERPNALPIDPAILEFEQGPRRAELPTRLYFAGQDTRSFAIETRGVPVAGSSLPERVAAVTEAWVSGPTSSGALGLVPAGLPMPTVFARAGTVYVDLPRAWSANQLGSAGEFLLVCGLANSLLELDGVKAVQYLMDGKLTETIGGHVETLEPFTVGMCRS